MLSSINKVSASKPAKTEKPPVAEAAVEPEAGAGSSSSVEVEAVAGASASLQERVEKAKMLVEERRLEKENAEIVSAKNRFEGNDELVEYNRLLKEHEN